MIRLRGISAAALLGAILLMPRAAAAASDAPLTEAYLIQNSGWMEPFYADRGSQFRAVVTALIDATQLAGAATVVATFNQNGQIPGHASPERIFSGAYDKAAVARAVAGVFAPRRADGKYADSDFYGALNGAVNDFLGGRQGIVWMATNNKASPDNSPEVLANTRRFYDDLRKMPYFSRLIAFPIRMRVRGPNYDERGFVIYGIAYGERAAAALDWLVADGQPTRRVFTAPPVRLKPLERDPLRLQLSAQSAHGMTVSLEGGRLVVRHVPPRGGRLSLTGDLINSYYPQQVETAKLSVETPSAAFGASASQIAVSRLGPGAALKNIRIDLRFPPATRPSIFTDHALASGQLLLKLSDATLTLSPEFVARMKDVFGVDLLMRDQSRMQANGLPSVFFDYRRVNAAATAVPVYLVYDFSPWPTILAFSGCGFALALLIAGIVHFARPRRYTVRIGAANVPVRLRPFERCAVQSHDGVRALVRGAIFGKPSVTVVEENGGK